MTERRSKQVLVVRKDLGMRKGKIAAQCAHASLKVFLEEMPPREGASPGAVLRQFVYQDGTATQHWLDGEFTKICVSVNSEEELIALCDHAEFLKLPCAIIRDAGHTEFHGVPTYTVLAIGPAWDDELDPITGSLPLL